MESDFVTGMGKDADGVMSRSVFSLDLAAKRPQIGRVNELYRKRSGKDLNDKTSRSFTTPLITQWRGGALKVAWPFDLALGELMYPLPKWADRK